MIQSSSSGSPSKYMKYSNLEFIFQNLGASTSVYCFGDEGFEIICSVFDSAKCLKRSDREEEFYLLCGVQHIDE